MDNSVYQNPLITRYASAEMAENFSDQKRFGLWRRLWTVLAESEMELGLPITREQVDEMKRFSSDIDFELAEKYEKEVRHDVMAHVRAFGEQAESAMPIIHLGATSCFVDCNSELIILNDALNIIKIKLLNVINNLKCFAIKYKSLPTLGFTHLQPAQLTTVGKRASVWLQDLVMDYNNLVNLQTTFKLRGVKGTTGTQASFMELFDGNEEKVKELEKRVVAKLGYNKVFAVTGQTYPRKFDYNILCVLSQIAQSAYKFSNDLRLLQSMKEVEEPFEKLQVGSSAMAYKRNPMRCERMSGLARFVVSLPINSAITASTQWFERTLDDSANRRIVNAQAFLALDGILAIYLNVSEGLVVNEKIIAKRVEEELPFIATENIMMECVKSGGNRQELHERIRLLSMKASQAIKEGRNNNLTELICEDKLFAPIHKRLTTILKAENFIGRAPAQVVEFIQNEVEPILQENIEKLGKKCDISL